MVLTLQISKGNQEYPQRVYSAFICQIMDNILTELGVKLHLLI